MIFLGGLFVNMMVFFLTKPSKGSIEKITDKVRRIIHKAAAWSQEQLIKALNPVITGWANYHRHIVAKKTFQKLDSIIWNMLWRWAKRKHPKKGKKWIARRYWHSEGTRNWVFKEKAATLVLFADTKIRRHFMVKLDKNPYLDRDYFLERLGKVKKSTPWIQTRLSYFANRRPEYGL